VLSTSKILKSLLTKAPENPRKRQALAILQKHYFNRTSPNPCVESLALVNRSEPSYNPVESFHPQPTSLSQTRLAWQIFPQVQTWAVTSGLKHKETNWKKGVRRSLFPCSPADMPPSKSSTFYLISVPFYLTNISTVITVWHCSEELTNFNSLNTSRGNPRKQVLLFSLF
jgi:hypothetical protein